MHGNGIVRNKKKTANKIVNKNKLTQILFTNGIIFKSFLQKQQQQKISKSKLIGNHLVVILLKDFSVVCFFVVILKFSSFMSLIIFQINT